MTEASCGPRSQRTHLALIEALRCIDDACRELAIAYWVDAGTLLGTIRHHGLIPWDDDVDLCMQRHELQQFVNHAPALLGSKYSVLTSRDEPAITIGAKVYINGTHIRDTFAETHGLPPTLHDGLSVDIVTMDPVSRFTIVRRLDRSLSWLVATQPRARDLANSPKLKSSRTRLRWMIAAHVPSAVIAIARRWLDWRATRHDGKLLAVHVAGLSYGWTYPSETIFPLSVGTFEDLTVPIPADPHAYLIGEFGNDYMTLPPKDQRTTHTDRVVFDEG